VTRASLHFPPILSLNFPSLRPCLSSSRLSPVLTPHHRCPIRAAPGPARVTGLVRQPPMCPRERRHTRAGRAEGQRDRLRCNWRAHYLVLSHRDNYPRGRYRLKYDDGDRRDWSVVSRNIRLSSRRVSERPRASSAEDAVAACDRRSATGCVLLSDLYETPLARADEGLKARCFRISLARPRYTRHFYWRRLSSPR